MRCYCYSENVLVKWVYKSKIDLFKAVAVESGSGVF